MSDKEIITNLQQRVRELKVTAGMLVDEAIIIERELERIYAPQVVVPGENSGNPTTEARIAKIRAATVRTLAKAAANS